jgi:diguanylate cyclase (GGDEF)-like protein/PAS domain S-box-containing protein
MTLMDRNDERVLVSILDQLEEGVYFVDSERRITLWNRAAETITGWPAESVVGLRCADGILRHCDGAGKVLCGSGCPMLAAMTDGEARTAEIFMLRRDGARVPLHVRVAAIKGDDGTINGCVEVFRNDSERSQVLEEIQQLRDAAMLDSLTGLPNRRFLFERLDRMMAEAHARSIPIGVLFVDIDHFKNINDTYGHEWGDEVLRVATSTLRSNLRAHDVIARWGGDEVLIVAPDLGGDGLRSFAERLRALIERCEVGRPEVNIRITASVGCTAAAPSEEWTSVTSRADRLMYESKRRGRNRVTQG